MKCISVFFGSTEGSGTEKFASWRSFNINGLGYRQHSPNIGPKMDQHSLKMEQHSPKILLPARPISPQHGPLAGCRAYALNPARGPPGPELAVALPYGSSLLSEEETGHRPCRRTPPPPRTIKKSYVLWCFLLFHFSTLVA